MSKTLKPGMLAYIVRLRQMPELNGHVVQLVRQLVNGEIIHTPNSGKKGMIIRLDESKVGGVWLVRGAHGKLPCRVLERVDGRARNTILYVEERPIAGENLRPITPPGVDTDTTISDTLPAKKEIERV